MAFWQATFFLIYCKKPKHCLTLSKYIPICTRVIAVVTDIAGLEILCKSCQNAIMRSNNLDVKVPGTIMSTEVEALAFDNYC